MSQTLQFGVHSVRFLIMTLVHEQYVFSSCKVSCGTKMSMQTSLIYDCLHIYATTNGQKKC